MNPLIVNFKAEIGVAHFRARRFFKYTHTHTNTLSVISKVWLLRVLRLYYKWCWECCWAAKGSKVETISQNKENHLEFVAFRI